MTIKDSFYIALGFGVVSLILTIVSMVCLKKIKPKDEEFSKCVIISLVKSFAVIGFVVSFGISLLNR